MMAGIENRKKYNGDINSVIEVTQLQSTWQKAYWSTADYENQNNSQIGSWIVTIGEYLCGQMRLLLSPHCVEVSAGTLHCMSEEWMLCRPESAHHK